MFVPPATNAPSRFHASNPARLVALHTVRIQRVTRAWDHWYELVDADADTSVSDIAYDQLRDAERELSRFEHKWGCLTEGYHHSHCCLYHCDE